jgi:hypothetical protein
VRRDLDPPSTMFSWRQIRHGQNHRRPMTHTEERMERDEATQPTQEQYDERRQWDGYVEIASRETQDREEP